MGIKKFKQFINESKDFICRNYLISETYENLIEVSRKTLEEHIEKMEVRLTLKNSKNILKTANRMRRILLSALMVMILCASMSIPAFAADDPLAVVNNLSEFIFGLIRAVGLILLGWGIVQVGLSFQSHDPSQRSNGFLTLAGGIVITFAKEILSLITG